MCVCTFLCVCVCVCVCVKVCVHMYVCVHVYKICNQYVTILIFQASFPVLSEKQVLSLKLSR